MNARYDVIILGCGEAGIFAAYELSHLHPELKVLALDQGADIYHRSCPIVAGKVKECIHCAAAAAGDGNLAPAPGDAQPLAAAGAFEVDMLLIPADIAPQAQPAQHGGGQAHKPDVFLVDAVHGRTLLSSAAYYTGGGGKRKGDVSRAA